MPHPLFAAVPPLAAGLLALAALFHKEAAAAVTVWLGSTAYNHCLLVAPIAAYLVWDRRAALSGVAPRPMPLLALAALPLSLAWLIAERIGFMEGRQLIALSGVELLFLGVLGGRAFAAFSGPLLYLYFLVPFGGFLTPALQDFTARFVMHGLDLLGVANYTDGYTIQIPEGTFYVAEACAGLRFLIASAAFGCLYALLIYRTWPRRAAFVAAALVVPVLANGARALGIVLLGHALGSAQAAEADHVLYGWIFFSIVTLLLILLGLPFREDQPRAGAVGQRPLSAPPAPRALAGTAAGVLAGCALGPLTALALTLAPEPAAIGPDLATAGCQADPRAVPERAPIRRYACDGLVLRAETFPAGAAPRFIVGEWARLTRLAGAEDATTWRLPRSDLPWTLTQTSQPPSLAAALLWQGGRPVEPGL
ncbi:MAG: exosortase, partial [Acetobacteraceae bacterium]|nr:exosortase [Acetobacteraceae bacterium]